MRMPPAFYDKDYLKTTVRARGRGSRERGCRATVHSVAHVAAGGIEEEMDKKERCHDDFDRIGSVAEVKGA